MIYKSPYKAILCSAIFILILTLAITGCKVTYSLSGASISPDAKTVSIAYFPNNAPMVAPSLSSTLTDELKNRFSRQTRLKNINDNGDLSFEGEIVGYMSTPAAISGVGADEGAIRNKLTITVRVRFANAIEPQYNFERTFSQFLEYPSEQMLQEAETTLIPQIVEMLVEDIFNAAVSNW